MKLRPLRDTDEELLDALEQQDDVWEFVGTLPLRDPGASGRVFAVVAEEGDTAVGVAGLLPSRALAGDDYELICAMRSEAQFRGYAKQACRLALAWAFETAGLERVIACIDDANVGARSIATKLGMREVRPLPPARTVFAITREEYGRVHSFADRD